MFIDGGADGELGHLQGHQYDTFNITNKDLAGHIQCTARTSFDNISCGVARVAFTEMISSGSVLMMAERNCKVSRQLSMNLSVSMLVKKPARS